MIAPLPRALGGSELVAWRLDSLKFAPTWDSGEGAYRLGGRWNSAGVRAVYCSLDPSTTILEVAVHRGFPRIDTIAHCLTSLTITDPAEVFVVNADDLPNPAWLQPGNPSAGQQVFGDGLLRKHLFALVPSVVSTNSWNLIFDALRAKGHYELRHQERFALDTRLSPPGATSL